MKTDDLIQRLGGDATVVTPLPSPGVRTTVWLVWAAVYLAMVAVFMLTAMSPGKVAFTPLNLLQQGAALVLVVTAAQTAFASVVPGAGSRAGARAVMSGAVWLATLLWGCWGDLQAGGTWVMMSHTDWSCVILIAIGGTVLWGPMVVMLRRGASLTPRSTAFLGALAGLTFANIAACLTSPHAFTITVLLWHGATVALTAALFAWTGPLWLRKPAWLVR